VTALILLRWEITQTLRGLAPHAAMTGATLASSAMVGLALAALSMWSPLSISSSGPGASARIDPTAPQLMPILGEYRGGVAFLLILIWLVLVAAVLGPAFLAGAIVRDRRSGRLDRVLTDATRADVVALVKLLAGLVALGLTVAAAAPSLSFAWLVGGLNSGDAIVGVAVFLILLVLVAAVSLICSALAATEVTALLASYALIGGILWGPLLAGIGLAVAGFSAAANVVVSVDPLVALLAGQPQLARGLLRLLPSGWPVPQLALLVGAPFKTAVPIWAADLAVYTLLATTLVWLTSVVLEPLHPLKTWRLRGAG